jgi:hypothetical protein
MKTTHILIGVGVAIAAVVAYKQFLAPKPSQPVDKPSGFDWGGLADKAKDLIGGFMGRPAPPQNGPPAPAPRPNTSVGGLDFDRSSYGERIPTVGFVDAV